MSDNLLHELELSIDQALKSQSVSEGIYHLKRALALYSEESKRLKTAAVTLQERLDGVNRELTKKVQELHRTTHFLNNILKNISDAILFIDLEGTVLLINQTGEKLLEVKGETVLFQKASQFFSDDFFGFSLKEALKFGISQKLLYKTILGKELEISTSFVYEGPKVYHGLILLFRDVSEKQKFQEALSRADRMKELGLMATTLAHEIRNPLGAIRGFASLLFRDLEKEPHLQEMASSIMEGTKALEKLVTTVLQYARPVEVRPESHDIVLFLKEFVRFIRMDSAFSSKVTIELHTFDSLLLAPIDPDAMKSALLNLTLNAFQAMEKKGGKLLFSLIKRETSYQISISDTGVGMDEENLSQIFSPFFTTKKKGNGLGLVEVQKIIAAHFGSIEVRSSLNQGTTFTLTLPLKR